MGVWEGRGWHCACESFFQNHPSPIRQVETVRDRAREGGKGERGVTEREGKESSLCRGRIEALQWRDAKASYRG